VSEIADGVGVHSDTARIYLEALVSEGVLERVT
jgi:predicted ArsR family transcriptional regulator